MSRTRALALWACLCLPAAAAAQDRVDVQLWTQALATVAASDDWRLHLELQPRWHENVSSAFQVLTRTGVGRRVNGALTLWAGHAWIAKPPGPGVTHEQRAWQQASITLPAVGTWMPSLRLRQEQRWQPGWRDASHRVRLMTRLVRPVGGGSRWSLATWNEAMLTLDDTAAGPARGVDQNRLFSGVLYRFSARESLEVGGMWVATNRPAGPHAHAFLPFIWLNLSY